MNNNGGITAWAIHNRRIVLLLTGLLFIAGIYALLEMPKQEMPQFVIRQGVVIGVFPGATSLEVEQQLTKPLERYLFTFPEVNRKKTHSKSKDGMAFIFVELSDNVKDKNIVWSTVKHGLNMFKSSLPQGVLAVIANDNFGDVASVLITLESDDKTYRELDSYLDVLDDRLKTIPSVANTHRFGSQKEQISIYVDNEKLSAYGIGTKLLMANLFAQGITLPGGTMDNDLMTAPVHIADSYRSEYEIGEQIIFADPDGSVVRVRDIARVVREYPRPDSYITNNGKKCILLSVEVRHEANIITFGDAVNRTIDAFRQELPESVNIYRIADQPKIVSEAIRTFLRELLMAIAAVILVTMLLLPFRVAAVAATSIPVSIAISLALMFMAGIPLNMVTLAALVVVLGMIVDNSVVIVDCYIDKLDHGLPHKKAAIDSAKEYLKSIVSATLAISVTFFPFLFTVSGTTRDFLEHFPWTVTITLGMSLLAAIIVIPVMQYALIRKGIRQAQEELLQQGKTPRRTVLDYVQSSYERLLAAAFAHPTITVSIAIASIVGGVLLFSALPQRMMPVAERDQFAVEIYLPQGSPLEKTATVCDSMENILRRDARVKSVTAFVGESSPRFHIVYAPNMPSKAYGQFIVNTVSNRATEEMLDDYTDRCAFMFPEAYVRFKQLDFQASEAPVEVRLTHDDIGTLKQQAERLTDYLNTLEECLRVHTSFEEPLAGVRIELNPSEAGRLGIQKAMAAMSMASGLTGSQITTLWEGDYAMPVCLEPENTRPGFGDAGNVQVSGLTGVSVPLRQVASVIPEWNDGQITHRNGRRTLTVAADIKRGKNINEVYAKLHRFMDEQLIPMAPANMEFEDGGMPETEAEVLFPMAKGILIALMIIFMILVFHCGKLSRATLIMSASLLSLFGAAFGIWVMGIEFSVTAMLGIVGLVGIIVRNGIIMFDCLETLRKEHGMTVREAAFEAGKRRMRPIFLTSAAASVGVLPMIISNSPLWSPLGVVIFFGTLFSMLLVITVLPVTYWLIFKES
ncbi:MAG: efflux RND transporter permease subunit [Bacteroidales bacterium]|jgi:multidrug efflux pump subunit AcrB|nr:efflux RND transporter permease subunit [Bacteroidales bacterium]